MFAAALAFCAVTAPAYGQSPAHAREYSTESVTVRVDGEALAWSEPRAAQQAHNAIVRAARRVCGLTAGPRLSLQQVADARSCVDETVEAAIMTADRRALNAYFAALDDDRRYATNFGPLPDTVLAAIEAAAG